MKKLIVVILASLAVSSCTFTPHEVALQAAAPIITSDVGEGYKIGVDFYDDRDNKTVGQRGAGMVGADISATNVMGHLALEVRKSLEAKGFELTSYNDPEASAKLRISLRTFKFFIETGFWTGANNVSVAMKADGAKGTNSYLKNYSFDSEERVLVVPDGSGIDAALNAALTDVLTQFATDKELEVFLATD